MFAFDASRWEPWTATRCAGGVAVPILLATALGHPSYGVLASLGALYSGLASFAGIYRAQLRQMMLTGVMLAVVTAIACMAGQSDMAVLIVVPIVAFFGALYATSSPGANSIATMTICAFVVLIGLGLPPESAVGNGALILSGAAVQTLLLTAAWPINPRFPERKAVSAAYRSLARSIRDFESDEPAQIPGTAEIENARTILAEAREARWRPEHEVQLEIMRVAEALRATLVGYAKAREQVAEDDSGLADLQSERIAEAIDQFADRVMAGRFSQPAHHAETLGDLPPSLAADRMFAHWHGLIRTLITDLDRPRVSVALEAPPVAAAEGRGWRRVFSKLTRLPDVRVLRSVAARHAFRYAVALELAVLATRVWKVPHGYWLPLTVAIVLRADFANTVTRGLSRLIGTIAGVTLAELVVVAFHPSQATFGFLFLAAAWCTYALFQPNYAAYSVGITLYVVFSVAASGLSPDEVGMMRLSSTVIGTVLALAAYVFWPAFHGRQIKEAVLEAFRAQIAFAESIPGKANMSEHEVDEARNHARMLRIQAENLFRSAILEPWGMDREELHSVEEAILKLNENAAELLALRAQDYPDPSAFEEILKSSKEEAAALER